MALEDIAMFRAIPNALVLYPSDAVSSERAIEIAANYRGPVYIRTSRPDTDIIYNNDEIF
jgi:transketolase